MRKPHALLMVVPALLLAKVLGQSLPGMDGRFILLLVIVAIALLLIFRSGAAGGRAAHIARTCRACGATHPGFARFCRRCGKRL